MSIELEPAPAYLVHEGDLPAEVAARYQGSRYLALDTETTGLNLHRDRLCLVQMTDEHGFTSLIRPAGDRAPRLQALLEDEGKLKIFHFARFDLAMLRARLGIRFTHVFCTKIASKLVRTYTDKHGLKDLVREFAGVELNKTEQSSDWARTDLSAEQLGYAAGDVRHLIALHDRLVEMLEREGRRELAEACFRFLPIQVELDLLDFKGTLEH